MFDLIVLGLLAFALWFFWPKISGFFPKLPTLDELDALEESEVKAAEQYFDKLNQTGANPNKPAVKNPGE